MKRVYLLSSRSLFGQGITSLLCHEMRLEIVGHETDIDRAVECIKELRPDVVIVDSADPEVDIMPSVMCILREKLDTKVVGIDLEDNTICIYREERREIMEVEDLIEAIEQNHPCSDR